MLYVITHICARKGTNRNREVKENLDGEMPRNKFNDSNIVIGPNVQLW